MTVREYLEELINDEDKWQAFKDKIARVHKYLYDEVSTPYFTGCNTYTLEDKLTKNKIWFTEYNERYPIDEGITDEEDFIKYIADYFNERRIEYYEKRKKLEIKEHEIPRKYVIRTICSIVFFAGLLVYFNFFSTQWANEASNLAIYNDYLVAKDSVENVVAKDTAFADSMFKYYSDSLDGAVGPVKVSKSGGYWYRDRKVIVNDDSVCIRACERKYNGNLEIACLSKCVTTREKYENEYVPVSYDTTWSSGIEFGCPRKLWPSSCVKFKSKSEYVKEVASELVDGAKDRRVKNVMVGLGYEFKPDKYRYLVFDDKYTLAYLERVNNDQFSMNVVFLIGLFISFIILGFILYKKYKVSSIAKAFDDKIEELKNS